MTLTLYVILLIGCVQNGRTYRDPWEGMHLKCALETVEVNIAENGCRSKRRKILFLLL